MIKLLGILALLWLLIGCQDAKVCEKTKKVEWLVHHIAPGEAGKKASRVDLEVCL